MSLIRSGLMGGTALTQKRVHDPISLAIAGAIVGQALVGTAVYYTVAFVAAIAVNAVVSFTLKSLATEQTSASGSKGLIVNASDPTAPREYVYGRIRKGGTITYYESTGSSNQFLHMILVVAGHEIDGYESIMINENIVTIDGSNFVTSHGWNSKIRIKRYTGTTTQTADADLLAESAQIDANFRGRGLAYLYIRLEYDSDVFANGIPLFTAIIRGKKVLDTRTAITAYSANWALCVRDYLVSSYGFDDVAGNIDTVSFNNGANISDEAVNLGSGGTIERYEIDGVISADESVGDVLRKMMTAGCGTLFWGGGKWRVKPGYYSSPVKSFTTDNLRSAIKLQTRQSLRDNFNIVRGKFNNEQKRWIEADYPEIKSATFIAQDNGKEKPVDMPTPFTTHSARSQRIAKMSLFRSREQMSFSADFDMNMFGVEVGDTVQLTIARYGWTNKVFEVTGWQLGVDSDNGTLFVSASLRETSAAAFSWAAEESTIINNDSNLPDPTAGLNITGISQISASTVASDGRLVCSAFIDWNNVSNPYLDYYQIQWKRSSESLVWDSTVVPVSHHKLNNLIEGISFDIRIRAVTTAGNRGNWSSTFTFTPIGDLTGPAAVTGFGGQGIEEGIQLFWNNPSDLDLKEVLIYENTTNTTSGATLIGKATGEAFTKVGIPANTSKWYFARTVDNAGNPGGWSSGKKVTAVKDTDVYNMVPDNEMLDETAWTNVNGTTKFDRVNANGPTNYSDGALVWVGALPITALENSTSKDFKVKPGDVLYCSAQVSPQGAACNVDLQIRFFTQDRVTLVSNPVFGSVISSSGSAVTVVGEITVPATAYYAKLSYRVNSASAGPRLISPIVYKKSSSVLLETNSVQRTTIADSAVTDKFQDTALTAVALTITLADQLTQTITPKGPDKCLRRFCSFEARKVGAGNTEVELQVRVKDYSGGAYAAWNTVQSWTITNTSYGIYTGSANLSGPFENVQYRLQARVTVASGTAAFKNAYLTIEDIQK